MKYRIAIQGEMITSLPIKCEGVGMIKSEALYNMFSTYGPNRALIDYLKQICGCVSPHPVVYRLVDWDASQARLAGSSRTPDDRHPYLGHRGLRWYDWDPEFLHLEMKALAVVRESHPNLQILLPFVCSPKEVSTLLPIINNYGLHHNVGIMIETPAAALEVDRYLELGISQFTFGINDLTNLMLGTYTRTEIRNSMHDAVLAVVRSAARRLRTAGATTSVGGYINAEFVSALTLQDLDYAIVGLKDHGILIESQSTNMVQKSA